MYELQYHHNLYITPENREVRHARVIQSGEFLDEYKVELGKLFEKLSLDKNLLDDPVDLVSMIREKWIGTEHGALKHGFDPLQVEGALQVLTEIGLTGEMLPPPGHFKQAVVYGGGRDNMAARAELAESLEEIGVTVDTFVVLAGQRPLDAVLDGTPENLLDSHNLQLWPYDISDHLDLHRRLINNSFVSETELALAALAGHFGKPDYIKPVIKLHDTTSLSRQEIDNALPKKQDQIPLQIVKHYDLAFAHADGDVARRQRAVVLNGAAVERAGKPRPTTESTIIEWLEWFAPTSGSKNNPTKVLVISTNPHALRMFEEMQRILDEMGRPDIEIVPATAAPIAAVSPSYALTRALGEVGRMINRSPSVKGQLELNAESSRQVIAA